MTTLLQFNPTSAFEGVQFVDIRSVLPVNPKYTWAQLAGVRPLTALNTIVVHHDGMSKASTAKYSDIELAKRIATSHINNKKNHPNGDPGFPYDLWIRNGVIYWCNDIEAREYGVAGNNGYTVNVCVSGEYKFTDALTDQDRKALYCAILMMQDALPEDRYIKGHNELSATHCPGFDMDIVRRDVKALEETMSYAIENNVQERIMRMFRRMVDLQGKYNDEKNPNHGEAVRKLLLVDDALKEKGFYQ